MIRSPITSAVSTPRFVQSLALCVLALALGACASSKRDLLNSDYVAAYNAGRYADAYDSASKAATSLRGGSKNQAALIAGLSAQALNRDDDATRWLSPLAVSTDAALNGKANAALGLIAQARGNHSAAFEHLSKAGAKLLADDGARALMYAGDSLKALGRHSEATQLWQQAREKVATDVQLRVAIGDRLAGIGNTHSPPSPNPTPPSTGLYTVQVGAFSTHAKAHSMINSYLNFGPTRVVPITSSRGQRLHAVRVGRYQTKSDAEAVRRQIGSSARVTQTTDE